MSDPIKTLRNLFLYINDRERYIFTQRIVYQRSTLGDCAKYLGVSKGRVRQMECKLSYKIMYKITEDKNIIEEVLKQLVEKGIDAKTLEELVIKFEIEKKKEHEQYTPIEIIGISPRTLNSLINGGIGSIEKILEQTESDISNLRGMGSKGVQEVKERLYAFRDYKFTLKNQ